MRLFAFDVGGTYIKYALVEENKILFSGKTATPITNFNDFLLKIEEITADTQVDGFTFSVPGVVDKVSGYIFKGGMLRYLDKCDFKNVVSSHFNKSVAVENDAICAVKAEMKFGAFSTVNSGVMITLGTGVGCKYVSDGEIFRGSHNCATELSMCIPLDSSFEKIKHIGNMLSTAALVAMARKAFSDDTLTGEALMVLAENSDKTANEVLDKYIDVLSALLFDVQILLDPEKIVIGGGISDNGFFIEKLREKMTRRMQGIPYRISDISSCVYKSQNNIYGAVLNYCEG